MNFWVAGKAREINKLGKKGEIKVKWKYKLIKYGENFKKDSIFYCIIQRINFG